MSRVKINGVVRDQAGEVLPGANVVIKELNLGSTADADGYYVIINISPGVYTLSAIPDRVRDGVADGR